MEDMSGVTLSEYLTSVEDSTEQREVELLGDDMFANRMLRELAAAEKQIKANADVATFERGKITDWETVVNTPLQNRAVYLRENLSAYALNQRLSADRKTISLPFGTLSTTAEQPKWSIDEDTFIRWACLDNTELIRTKHAAALSEIKKVVTIDSEGNAVMTATGEEVPGVTATTGTTFKATVKPN